MTVTTGGRETKSSGFSSNLGMKSSTSMPTFSTVQPKSTARMPAVSASTIWLAVAILPPAISLRMRSAVRTPMRWERSLTEMPSCTLMTFLSSAILVMRVF